MHKWLLIGLSLLPLAAAGYPIELSKKMNGAEVSVSSQEIDQNIAGVVLHNYGSAQAQCEAVFRNGPEAPRRRQATVGSGDSVMLSMRFNRQIMRLRVEVQCHPAKPKSD